MEIEPGFRQARERALARQDRAARKWWRAAILLVAPALVLLGAGLWWTGQVSLRRAEACRPMDPGEGQVGQAFGLRFIDLPGDPMILHLDTGLTNARRVDLLRPPDIPAGRIGGSIVLLSDELLPREERIIAVLPSRREDFAFLRAQRDAGRMPGQTGGAAPSDAYPADAPSAGGAPPPPMAQDGPPGIADAAGEAGRGDRLPTDCPNDLPAPILPTATPIENTTTLLRITPEAARQPLINDRALRILEGRDLAGLLASNGLAGETATGLARRAIALLPEFARLQPDMTVALRTVAAAGGGRDPVQLGLYGCDRLIGSLALSDAGDLIRSADPWPDGFACAAPAPGPGPATLAEAPPATGRYRLLDTFYSAALRNGVPASIVGETVALLSQAFDLEAFAAPGDRMRLAYAPESGAAGSGPGQVLFVAIDRKGEGFECYVVPAQGSYACYRPLQGGRAAISPLRDGLLVPVAGTMISGFGPQADRERGGIRVNEGIDWAAPLGSEVRAAREGTVVFAGPSGRSGNLLRLSHGGGLETLYAHLDGFAAGVGPGVTVRAGQVIGRVGNTGLSAGPHLHFELRQRGEAVDPMNTDLAGSAAVEMLVEHIIRVESGGRADAKNPNSTALGLGQFIDGTWLRMMRSYRPDLAASMPREALLALRLDPTLAREMVQALAREGEAYLRARGHEITAGRLYLSHFLGQEGAHRLLSAAAGTPAVDVVGAAVQQANPSIITGRSVAGIVDWAERLMSGPRDRSPAPAPVPPDVRDYELAVNRMLVAL